MTYTVTDEDGDTDALNFAITVQEAGGAVSGYSLNRGQFNARAATFARDRFYVADDFEDRVYAYSASGTRDTAADFDLNHTNEIAITYANGRFYVIDGENHRVSSYSGARVKRRNGGDSGGEDTSSEPPQSPANAHVARQGSSVSVSRYPSPGATRNEIWRCDTRAGPPECEGGVFFDRSNWTNLARTITATSYVDRNPPASTSLIPFEIHYSVQACNRAGCWGPIMSGASRLLANKREVTHDE